MRRSRSGAFYGPSLRRLLRLSASSSPWTLRWSAGDPRRASFRMQWRRLSDAELMSRHAELIARLEGLEAQLRALPTAPVEPPHVGLTMDTPALLASIAGFGRIVAPLGISAADVTLEGVPSHVRPGQTLQLRLALGDRHAEQSTEELEVSLGALAAAVPM